MIPRHSCGLVSIAVRLRRDQLKEDKHESVELTTLWLLGILHALGQIGHSAIVVLVALLGAYIGYKYFQRQRLLRKLRIARISVDELRRKLEAGEDLLVVDLRSAADLRNDPFIIKGALHVHLHELELRHVEIPRDRDVILYCSCPNEVTSARMALLLHKRGITRVRPPGGGINAWRKRNYPVVPYAPRS